MGTETPLRVRPTCAGWAAVKCEISRLREFADWFGRGLFVLSKRELVIVSLLERYAELVEPGAKLGVAGDGDSLPLPPRTYTSSVRELERLLTRMREERRSQWWHVSERYLRCRQATKDVPVKRKGKNGKTATVLERQVVTSWDSGVRLEKVRRGVEWLAEEWSLPSEPMLPQEVLVAA